jgi:predicted metal-dependent phosphoesterase TrpH
MIDLHVHSNFSDGTYTPTELVGFAAEGEVSAVALTDHDTIAGIGEFLEACGQKGVLGIPGVEISADHQPGSMHMLGYLMDCEHKGLLKGLGKIINGREDRNAKILKKLNRNGVDITWEDVLKHAGSELVGRPHFAMAMVEAKHVGSVRAAFDRYLARGEAAYVDRYRMSAAKSIKMIRDSGGVAVLAHPGALHLDRDELRDLVKKLSKYGLQGMEVYYSDHNKQQLRLYLSLVKDFGLIATGGTDFHGAVNPKVKLGKGYGSLCVPDELIAKLYEAAGRPAPSFP